MYKRQALRRTENTPRFLKWALPRFSSSEPKLQFLAIRGNVDTRLSKLNPDDPNSDPLDGVILALAGLNRLNENTEFKNRLDVLLDGTLKMVLPLQECPAAPAQGALAIECRSENSEIYKIIQSIHCETTQKDIQNERKLLKIHGGCLLYTSPSPRD